MRFSTALLLMIGGVAAAQTTQPAPPMSLEAATTAALQQVSAFHQAQIDQRVAAEDLKQAQAALLPRARDAFSITYNSPLKRPDGGVDPTEPSFIAANAVHEYQNLLGVTGDVNYGLFAAVSRARAMLRAAQAGTEVARRAFIRATGETYYGAALATARRQALEQGLAAAEELQRITSLNYQAGEVPEVDVLRARLATAGRRDDLAQAVRDEAIANATLGTLLGYDITTTPSIEPLPQTIDATELGAITSAGVARRPEFAQLQAQVEAAHADVGVARSGMLPRITYSVDEGFDTSSLENDVLHEHRGVLATASVDVPLFEWGAGRSRVRQAELRAQGAEVQRQLTTRALYLEFASARQSAITAAERVDNARRAAQDAERNASVSLSQYRAGEVPINVATDAQAALATQRLVLQQALFDYQVARARLREAAGE
jgi:outer membrane protein